MLFRPRNELPVPDKYDAAGSYTNFGPSPLQELTVQTLFAQVRTHGLGGGNLGRVFNHSNSAGSSGVRLQVNSTTQWAFGGSSTGTSTAPLIRSSTSAITFDAIQHVACTWDGGLTAAGMNMYTAQDRGLLALDNLSTTDGTGSLVAPTGNQVTIGNRDGAGTRNFDGDIFVVARWRRILSLTELRIVQRFGPLFVPDGLVFCYVNRRDIGPYRLGVIGRSVKYGAPSCCVPIIGVQRLTQFTAATGAYVLDAAPGAFVETGIAVDALYSGGSQSLLASPGSFALTSTAANLVGPNRANFGLLARNTPILPEVFNATTSDVQFLPNPTQNLAGPQTFFTQVRVTGAGENALGGYVYTNTDASIMNGIIARYRSDTGAMTFAADSTGAANVPAKNTSGSSVTANKVQHFAATYDGGLLASGINVYFAQDGSVLQQDTGGTSTDGSGATRMAGGTPHIGNRIDTNRTFNGEIFVVARWSRILNLEELRLVQRSGPQAVPVGLIFHYANGVDQGPFRIPWATKTDIGRARVSNFIPRLPQFPRRSLFVVSSPSGAPYTLAAAPGDFTLSAPPVELAYSASNPVVDYSSAQTSVKNTSYVDVISGVPSIHLEPRLTTFETTANTYTNVVARVTGVNGLRPQFIIPQAGANWPWDQSNDKAFFSYDGLTWTRFDTNPTFTSGYVYIRHSTGFTSDTVWFARDRREGVAQIRDWIDNTLVANYPSLISNLTSGVNYVVDTYSAQTGEDGRTIAATPLFGFKISSGGSGKLRMALLSGVHAGEDYGTTCYKRAIEWLCGSSAEAIALRSAFDFICLPLMNAPGREGGHTRAQFEVTATNHNDLNRHFEDTTNLFETVSKPRAILEAEITDNQCAAVMDWHGFGLNGSATFLGYYTGAGSALESTWITKLGLRIAVANLGGTPASCTTTWGVNARHAQVTNPVESNNRADKSDSNAVACGQAAMLTLYDMLAANDFNVPDLLNTSVGSFALSAPQANLVYSGAGARNLLSDVAVYALTGYPANLQYSGAMPAYPTMPAHVGSVVEFMDGVTPLGPVNGSVYVRTYASAPRRRIAAKHRLTDAELTTLEDFYAANRSRRVSFSWRGTSYEVMMIAPPKRTWVPGPNKWQVEVEMVQQ